MTSVTTRLHAPWDHKLVRMRSDSPEKPDDQSPTDSPEPSLSECVAEPELAGEIERISKLIYASDGELLFEQGDVAQYLYYVKRGEVTLMMMASDRVIMKLRAGAGSVVGLPAVIGKQPYSMRAMSHGDSEVYRGPAEKCRKMIQDNPRVSFNVLRILAAEVRAARAAMSTLLG